MHLKIKRISVILKNSQITKSFSGSNCPSVVFVLTVWEVEVGGVGYVKNYICYKYYQM